MPETVTLSTLLPAPPDVVYAAWLDSEDHAAFTGGGEAFIDPRVGGRHRAWDGYILGVILELLPGSKIVQSWRTTEFGEGVPDSRLEVHLSIAGGATRLTLVHSDLPAEQAKALEKGWETYYFAPMRDWFAAKAAARAAAHAGLPVPGGPVRKPARAPPGRPGSSAKARPRPTAPLKAHAVAKAKARPAAKKLAAKPKPAGAKASPQAKRAAARARPAVKKGKPKPRRR